MCVGTHVESQKEPGSGSAQCRLGDWCETERILSPALHAS